MCDALAKTQSSTTSVSDLHIKLTAQTPYLTSLCKQIDAFARACCPFSGTVKPIAGAGSADETAKGFVMKGPMVALLMPFKPNTLEIDDAAFVKYLDVST